MEIARTDSARLFFRILAALIATLAMTVRAMKIVVTLEFRSFPDKDQLSTLVMTCFGAYMGLVALSGRMPSRQ